jgi:hypothetical protein
MAENNRTQSRKVYYSVIDGELRRKARQEDNIEYVKKRTRKDGTEVSEYVASSISGNIKSFEIKTEDFGGKKISKLSIDIQDIGDEYNIQIPVESRYFSSFITKLPNLSQNNFIELSVYDFVDKSGKKVAGVTIKLENGEKVTDFYNKENPIPGVPNYPANGDDDEKKLWGIQRTKALKSILNEQSSRFANSEQSESIPF